MHFDRSMEQRLRLKKFWLGLLCVLVGFAASAQEKIYVVKRSDTLTSIARQHGVTVAQLADRNSILRQTHVNAGQKLIIPSKATSSPKAPPPKSTKTQTPAKPPPAAAPALPASVQTSLNRAPVKVARWKYIVVHHSGVDTGTMKGMDEYHRKVRHMEHGLAYHFVIGNGSGMGDGEIAVSRRWIQQLDGGHLRSEEQNKVALGICLVGNFETKRPTEKQMRALESLTQALMKRCKLSASAVRTHQQINVISTRCPGRYFPAKNFLEKLKR